MMRGGAPKACALPDCPRSNLRYLQRCWFAANSAFSSVMARATLGCCLMRAKQAAIAGQARDRAWRRFAGID